MKSICQSTGIKLSLKRTEWLTTKRGQVLIMEWIGDIFKNEKKIMSKQQMVNSK